jgi:hypothetical protein
MSAEHQKTGETASQLELLNTQMAQLLQVVTGVAESSQANTSAIAALQEGGGKDLLSILQQVDDSKSQGHRQRQPAAPVKKRPDPDAEDDFVLGQAWDEDIADQEPVSQGSGKGKRYAATYNKWVKKGGGSAVEMVKGLRLGARDKQEALRWGKLIDALFEENCPLESNALALAMQSLGLLQEVSKNGNETWGLASYLMEEDDMSVYTNDERKQALRMSALENQVRQRVQRSGASSWGRQKKYGQQGRGQPRQNQQWGRQQGQQGSAQPQWQQQPVQWQQNKQQQQHQQQRGNGPGRGQRR